MKDAQTSAPIRFGSFELDPRTGELRKQGLRVRLQEQPFKVLQVLLEHPGEVVTREELQQRIWPSDTFVDFDHGVYNAIQKLRDALEDSAESPRFIETLSRRGYRFLAPVNGPGVNETAVPAAPVVRDSIVVLPFINMSSEPENEFFVDGISEEIINALAQIKPLRVVARSSAFSFKGKHIDPRTIGEKLNVRTVLEGSVRRSGNRLRITAQLINADDGYHLWSERYDRDMKDVFDIQDEIARSIADRLRITLEGTVQEPLVKAGTKNLQAYELYLKGRTLLFLRGSAIPRALESFRRAVDLDDQYALAWAGLADCYIVLGYYGLADPEASMPNGTRAARRAVQLGAALAEAHNALAMAYLLDIWDQEAAEREFLCALELNPRYIQARDWYALFYLQLTAGRLQEGVSHARLAVESDPLSGYANAVLGLNLCVAGSAREALQFSRRGVELDPESFIARWILHITLHLSEQFEEAVAVGEAALAMSGRHPWAMATLAATLADWGKHQDARAIYAELVARSQRSYVQPCELAITAAAAEMRDEAMVHACTAVQIRDPFCRIKFPSYWPYSRRLHCDPRFREILLRTGIQ